MTEQREKSLRAEICQFAEAMEATVSEHDDERGDGWKRESVHWLLERFREEAAEMEAAFENCDPEALAHEIIDAANFLMFAFFKLSQRS